MFSNNKSGRSGGGRGGFRRDGDSSPRRSFGGDRSGGERSFSKRPSFGGDRDGGERVNFKAVCDDCGNDCMVPFKPSGNKPIYCSSCFEKHGNGRDSSSDSRPSFRSGGSRSSDSSSDLKNQLYHIEDKLDQLLELLKNK